MKLDRYFGSRSFYKEALLIGLPVMGQQLIQNLVSLIDNFMVAGLGDVKMSGVNTAGQLIFIFSVIMGVFCSCGGIFMSQYFGAKDKWGMRQSLCFKIVVNSLAGIAFSIVCLTLPRQLLQYMLVGNTQAEEILDVAVEYSRIMALCGIPFVISNVIASSLREIGQVRPPLIISVVATLVNTFLNWILIFGKFGAPRLEVAGAAIATVIARTVEAVLFLLYVKKVPQPFNIRLSDLKKIDWPLFRTMLRKSGMFMFSDLSWVISETVSTALYNSRGGADVVSGMSASFAIANLYFVAFSGITTATAILLGRTLGEGRLDEARKQKTWLLSASVVFGFAMTVLGVFTMVLVPIVFGSLSASSQSICRKMVFYMALLMPIWVYNNTQFAVSRSGGDTRMNMLVDGISTLAIAIPLTFALAWWTDLGPVAMYIIVKLVDILKVIICHFWLKKEYWVKNLTIAQ